MKKVKEFKYGWKYGGNDEHQQFVYDDGIVWGLTKNFNEAKVFPSIESCQQHYLSKHSFPVHYEHCLLDGYLQYFDSYGQQLIV